MEEKKSKKGTILAVLILLALFAILLLCIAIPIFLRKKRSNSDIKIKAIHNLVKVDDEESTILFSPIDLDKKYLYNQLVEGLNETSDKDLTTILNGSLTLLGVIIAMVSL